MQLIALAGVVLGGLYYAVDLREAAAQKEAAEAAARFCQTGHPQPSAWFWPLGLPVLRQTPGMAAAVPDVSRIQSGDWLVVPDSSVQQQQITREGMPVELVEQINSSDQIPFRTFGGYYGGRTPLQHRDINIPRLIVKIYRVTSPFIPASPKSLCEKPDK